MRTLALTVMITLLASCGADGPRSEMPAPTLGSTIAAERKFRPLMRTWVLGTPQERQALDGQLAAFERNFSKDDLLRMALVLRAFNALDRADHDEAMDLAHGRGRAPALSPLFGPAGTSRDLATLVVGSVELRRGDPHKALVRLTPLLRKMLDDFATEILNETLVRAALGAHEWPKAVRFMEVWQHELASGSDDEVEERIRSLLAIVPKDELFAALEQRVLPGDEGEASVMAKLIAQQLAVVSIRARDSGLANKLVPGYKALLGSYGEAVARLAVDTTRGKVAASTVGLLVSLRDSALRRRSADVTSGMSYGLGIPGSGARLVTREAGDDPDQVRRALSELAGDGAAVIVAGVDALHSEPVAVYARDNSLPVLLLTSDPSRQADVSPFVFLVGERPSKTAEVLSARLRDGGAKVVAGLGAALRAGDALAGIGLQRDCLPAPTAVELDAERVDAVVVYDGAYCAQDLVTVAGAARARLAVGLGPRHLLSLPRGAMVLSAGVFPVDVRRPDPRIGGWLDSGRAPPSWWTALGRDAAVLALDAVKHLEETSGDDREEVLARRIQAASALGSAHVVLWTSAASGFAGSQHISRTITIVAGADRGAR